MLTIIIRCSGSACAPNTRLVFSSHDRRLRSTHKRVVLPTRYGPVGFSIGNTGANTPASVETDAPAAPSTATHRHRIFGTHTPLTRPSAFRPVHVTALRYAGTTRHRVPSSLACARMISAARRRAGVGARPPARRRRFFRTTRTRASRAGPGFCPKGGSRPGDARARSTERLGSARGNREDGPRRGTGARGGGTGGQRAREGDRRRSTTAHATRGRGADVVRGGTRACSSTGGARTHASFADSAAANHSSGSSGRRAARAERPDARAARTKTSAPPALEMAALYSQTVHMNSSGHRSSFLKFAGDLFCRISRTGRAMCSSEKPSHLRRASSALRLSQTVAAAFGRPDARRWRTR